MSTTLPEDLAAAQQAGQEIIRYLEQLDLSRSFPSHCSATSVAIACWFHLSDLSPPGIERLQAIGQIREEFCFQEAYVLDSLFGHECYGDRDEDGDESCEPESIAEYLLRQASHVDSHLFFYIGVACQEMATRWARHHLPVPPFRDLVELVEAAGCGFSPRGHEKRINTYQQQFDQISERAVTSALDQIEDHALNDALAGFRTAVSWPSLRRRLDVSIARAALLRRCKPNPHLGALTRTSHTPTEPAIALRGPHQDDATGSVPCFQKGEAAVQDDATGSFPVDKTTPPWTPMELCNLQAMVAKLICFMWERRRVELEDLSPEVWSDPPADQAICQAQKKANKFLVGYGYTLSKPRVLDGVPYVILKKDS